MELLLPGLAHPNRPEDCSASAAVFGVPQEHMQSWLDRGLPAAGGLIDPVLAADWITRNDLAGCPVLARRWRLWLDWFRLARDGRDSAPRRLRILRDHSLYLPHPVDQVRWWIPRLPSTRGQQVLVDGRCDHPRASVLPASWRLDGPESATVRDEIELRPTAVPLEADLRAVVEEVAGDFAYGWRHHRPGQAWSLTAGTCLDAAMALGNRLSAVGRPWRIVAGVIARSAIAGQHLWLETEGTDSQVRLDPSLPAIVRALAPLEDWRSWIVHGGTDTRCVTTVVGDLGVAGIPGGMTAGGAVGEAVATIAGRPLNAWACLDAPCGVTRWQFTTVG